MILNKGLNLDGLPDTVETGDYRYAENIVLDSTYKLPTNENGMEDIGILLDDIYGIIPFDKGIIVFTKFVSAHYSRYCIKVIYTNSQTETKEYLKYNIQIPNAILNIIDTSYLIFDKEQPIRGTTSYNQRGDLICIFSCGVNGNWEDKIINFNSYETLADKVDETYNYILTPSEIYLLDINPNVQFPNITNESIEGSLLTGSYQIAVTYKIDKEYTNYSLLSLPYYVYGHSAAGDGLQDGLAPNSISTEGINYIFINLDSNYKYYKLAVIYNDGTVFKVYTTPDIKIKEINNNYKIQNLNTLEISTLNDVLIKSIFYSNSESLNIMNNRLYRANLRSQNIIGFDEVAQTLANSVTLHLNMQFIDTSTISKSKQYIKFQSDEVYLLYLTLGDKKGNILGSYPIFTEDVEGLTRIISSDNASEWCYHIPSETIGYEGSYMAPTQNHITVTLNDIDDILGNYKSMVGFWCIHRAQRTSDNSKIYTQGIATQDVKQEDATVLSHKLLIYSNPELISELVPGAYITDERLAGVDAPYNNSQFTNYVSKIKTRFYSFEDLFSKNDYFPTNKLVAISTYNNHLIKANIGDKTLYTDEIRYSAEANITEQLLCEGDNITVHNYKLEATRKLLLDINNNFLMKSAHNIGTVGIYDILIVTNNGGIGDVPTFYIIDSRKLTTMYRCNALTNTTHYYKYIYNETLNLCSNIQTLDINNNICIGDTYYSSFKLYLKRLFPEYDIPDDGSSYKYKVIPYDQLFNPAFTDPFLNKFNYEFFIESKYNIHARYWEGKYPDYEQPINTPTQLGYNKVYNLQNTEDITTIVDINNNEQRKIGNVYNTRIIKSTVVNQESNQLGFRKYLALDYFDMPYNRGAIKALYSTYKNMYIQQELSLAVASIKDVISYQDGATYVGTGELFDRQPNEMIPTGYGYIGCESYFNTGICDLGYWVIDSMQSQIFLLTDNGIAILTEGKCKRWFKDKLHGVNPFKNKGSYITYDKQLKRFLLTVTNDDESKAFTISYVPEIKNWFSFHYYTPLYGVYTRNDTYFLIQSDTLQYCLFKYVDSIKSQFKSENIVNHIRRNTTDIQKMIISIYHNDHSDINKLYEVLSWDTSFVINAVDIFDKTFTEINITNDSQSTGTITVNDNKDWWDASKGVYKNNVWLFNEIFDYIKDNKINIFNPTPTDIYNAFDLNNDNIDTTLDWFEISRFISTFVCCTFIFDNLYYSAKGNLKGLTSPLLDSDGQPILDDNQDTIDGIQPTLSLKDIDFDYKRNNR